MSTYNLTETQKTLLQCLVGFQNEGRLAQPMLVTSYPSPTEYSQFVLILHLRNGEANLSEAIPGIGMYDFTALSQEDLLGVELNTHGRPLYFLKQAGIDAVKMNFASQGELPVNARMRILQTMRELHTARPRSQFVGASEIAETAGLDLDTVRIYLGVLAEDGFVILCRTKVSFDAALTDRGRVALAEPENARQGFLPPIINIFPVIDSQIQNLTQGGSHNVVSQTVGASVDEGLLQIVQQMVEIVRASDASSHLKQDYELKVEQLGNELKKSRINLPKIRDILAFLGDTEGALGLTARLAPYIPLLWEVIERLIHRVP